MAAQEKNFKISAKRDQIKEKYISKNSSGPVDCEFKLSDFPKMDNVLISNELAKLPFSPEVR